MSNYRNPIFSIDFYKSGHYAMYPDGTRLIFSNSTNRSSRIDGLDHTIFFGLQYFVREYLINTWRDLFFSQPKEKMIAQYNRIMTNALGPGKVSTDHIAALHDLQYLPICIMALPEGTRVPIGIPSFVIYNTLPGYFWLTNYIETIISASTWQSTVSATIADAYKKTYLKYAQLTGVDPGFVQFQGHDFSFRGMSSLETAAMSGAAHLTSFVGTDTVPSILWLEQYYYANADKELIGCSVPATEHSVVCAGGDEDELETISRLLDKYPEGFLSMVSDTWDYWNVLTTILPKLKHKIMQRNGKYVIRPDSGDPYKIIVGDDDAPEGSPERLGSVQILYNLFGGKKNAKGFIEPDSHIGLIYGDSITLKLADRILEGLVKKGFASNWIVNGIGSFTYQYNTRDTFGNALKATYAEIGDKTLAMYKNPKTDSGIKKSAKGLLAVYINTQGKLYLKQEATWEEVNNCEFKTVFSDGGLFFTNTLQEVRHRIAS